LTHATALARRDRIGYSAQMLLVLVLASAPLASTPPDRGCSSPDAAAVVVCGRAAQPYRIDPNVAAAARQTDRDLQGASSATPAAQAACARSPMGCGKGLESLDLANVGLVVSTMAVKAATGKDWAEPLRPAGPGEYQRYREAKQMREEREANRAARALRDKARNAAERQQH
jgi:hypothetical protein